MPIRVSAKIKPFIDDAFKLVDAVDIDGEIGIDQVVAAIRDGSIVLPDETTGVLPDAGLTANQGRIAVSGNHILQSIDHGAVDKVVVFKRYGPTRVVLTGEPARSSQEDNYQGAFNVPPDISVYDASDFLWDRGSQVWLFKQNQNDATWRSFGGPAGFAHGSLYADETTAARHVTEVGKVYVIGQGSGQHVFIVSSFTAATDENWQWDPLGISYADVTAAVAAHNTATDAHNDIRSSLSTAEDRLDALNALQIEPYDSTATYSRGSANSIVTHASGLFIYISSTERSSGHDPDTQPGYWLELSEGVTYEVISSGSHRIAARTLVVDGATDQVYLCTTTQTTPRDLTYIKDQAASIGGTFIELTAMIPTTWKGPHVIGQNYEAGDRVTTNANTRIYTARVDTGETPPHADWIQTGPVGSGGGGSDLEVSDEGTSLTTAATGIDFTGGGVTATESGGTVTVNVPAGGGSGISESDADARYARQSENLSDLDSAATARTNLGLGSAAEQESSAFLSQDGGDARYLNEASNLSDLPNAGTARTNLGLGTAATRDTGTGQNNVPILDASGDVDASVIPIDNTLQVDGSGDLGVQISTVIDLLDEDIRYYSTDTTREDARQASKGVVFLDTSRYAKRIHSVEWDFEGDGVGHNYTTFFVRIDSNDDIDFVYGESETLFNVGTSGTRRFNFDSSGLRIPGSVERLGLFITRTGSDDTWETKVYRGQPASDSPRESYPDASVDFPFWRSARFASGRPEPGEHIDNYITNGEIYGYPKIRYTLELEHASLVGDGNIEASHIDSGSAAVTEFLGADGNGGSVFKEPPSGLSESEVDARVTAGVLDFAETGNTDRIPASKIPGSLTHRQAQAVTVSGSTLTIPTEDSVQGGDTVLFVIPTPWSVTGNLTVRVSQGGTVQADTTFALNDRVGTRLTGGDVVADEEMKIVLATDWRSLVHPVGTGSAFDLHEDVTTAISTLDENDRFVVSDENLSGDPNRYVTLASIATKLAGTGLTATSGVLSASATGPLASAYSSTALYELGGSNSLVTFQNQLYFYSSSVSRSSDHSPETHPDYWIDLSTVANWISLNETDSVRIPGGTFVILPHDSSVYLSRDDVDATAERNAAWVRSHAGQGEQFILVSPSGISWGFQIDTVIVPELNQDAITDARIVLEDSGLTHYLTFLDWTASNLDMIDHLPVGAHIGLRQGTTTRILEVAAEWDSTNERYQVTNFNTGILTEAASGTATELLLTAGAGGGTTVAANPTGSDGDDLTRIAIDGTNYNVPSGGVITGFTELRAPATLDVAQTWTATGATIPAADGDEWVRMNGNFDGEVPENFEFLSSRLRNLAEHLVGGSTSTGDVERLQFHDGSVFQRVLMARTAANEIILRHEASTQALGNLSVYSYSAIAGDGDVTLTPRTEAAHNFDFSGTIQSGQERDLFDTNITLPTGVGDNDAFLLRALATHGSAEILLTKALLEELVAVAPVTWSTSATGTAVVQIGATRNAYFFPLGQNRGFYVGRSTEDPLRLLWAYSHDGAVVIDMQLMTLAAAGGAGAAGSTPSEMQEGTPGSGSSVYVAANVNVPSGTWLLINFGTFDDFLHGDWHWVLVADLTGRTVASAGDAFSEDNAVRLLVTEENYMYIGHTGGTPDGILYSSAPGVITPDTIRVMSME